jgi:WhiB family redox-sensing transcriptional regulator
MSVAETYAEDPTSAWRSQAACHGIDPDVFFPVGSTGRAIEHIATAKAICSACQVREECLEFALETSQGFGIWGGRDEDERRRLRRTRLAEQRLHRRQLPESA